MSLNLHGLTGESDSSITVLEDFMPEKVRFFCKMLEKREAVVEELGWAQYMPETRGRLSSELDCQT